MALFFPREMPVSDTLAVLPQYLLPKKALTAFGGRVAGARGGKATTALIRWFIQRYHVNMAEAANPAIAGLARVALLPLGRWGRGAAATPPQ